MVIEQTRFHISSANRRRVMDPDAPCFPTFRACNRSHNSRSASRFVGISSTVPRITDLRTVRRELSEPATSSRQRPIQTLFFLPLFETEPTASDYSESSVILPDSSSRYCVVCAVYGQNLTYTSFIVPRPYQPISGLHSTENVGIYRPLGEACGPFRVF
jgi:hypothetical protein